MTKLIVAILAGNCERYIDLCINSIKDHADKIVIIYDTSSKDQTWEKLVRFQYPDAGVKDEKFIILKREYEHDYNVKSANSDARNFYLDYLKKNHEEDWCLVLDADEVVDEAISDLKFNLSKADPNIKIISPRMVHFIGDLAHEDSTREFHFVPNRLFKIHKELYYPDGEHPVLSTTDKTVRFANTGSPIIYHLAYALHSFYIKDRYLNHLNKSEIHNPEYLKTWYLSHLVGEYPRKKLDIMKIPKVIRDEFLIDEILETQKDAV